MRTISARILILAIVIALALSPAIQFRAEAQAETAETWTFMVYMSGDSSLSSQIQADIQEMMKIGSGNGLEVIALMDRADVGDSTLARILDNGMEDIPLSGIDPAWGDELNMGDPSVLAKFVNWTVENYPSDRFMLDLWGHGNGWPGTCPDKGDYLKAEELRAAMTEISNNGITLDIISIDACQMGQVEIAYELRHAADYALLSQKDVPTDGWPYDLFLGHLKGNGTVAEKAGAMIDTYVNWGMNGHSLYSLTLALVDLDNLDELVLALNGYLANATLMTGFFNPEFIEARSDTEHYDGNFQYDIVHLLQNINNSTGCLRLEELSAEVIEAMDACIVHENHWTNIIDEPADNAHGLSIWFPSYSSTIDYTKTDFAKDSVWPDFLNTMSRHFQEPGRMDSPIPANVTALDTDSDGLKDTIRISHAGQGVGVMTTVDIYGPNGSLFHQEIIGAGPESAFDIALDGLGAYKVAIYQEVSNGILKNYSLITDLAKEGVSVISGRVTSNTGRSMAWVGVSLVDGSGKVVNQVFTDNEGFYQMEVVVPRDTNGTGLSMECGLGSGRQNITIGELGASNIIDFQMDISSAYIPWVVRAIGLMNLVAAMMLIYWVAWGRDRKQREQTEKLLVEQPIPPQ